MISLRMFASFIRSTCRAYGDVRSSSGHPKQHGNKARYDDRHLECFFCHHPKIIKYSSGFPFWGDDDDEEEEKRKRRKKKTTYISGTRVHVFSSSFGCVTYKRLIYLYLEDNIYILSYYLAYPHFHKYRV